MQVKIDTSPTECTLYLTDVCNFNCAGCRRQTVEKPRHKEVDLELVRKILEAYPTLQGFCVAGYGEPTLAKQFPEVIDYLIENGKYVGVITNGTYPDRLLQLKKNPNYISISLYGYNDEQYKEYVGASAYKKVIENFKTLKARFGNVGFSYFLNKENYKRLDKILALCDEIQPAFLNLANYLAYDSVETEDTRKIIRITDIDIIKYIEERCGNRKYINAKPIYLDDKDKEYNCPSYSSVINIDGQGNIGGCQRQMPPSITYGNMFVEDDPYNNIQMSTLRKRINEDVYPHTNCANCFGRHNPVKIAEKVNTIVADTNVDLAIMLLFHEKVDQTIECLKSFIPSGKNIYILNNGSSAESTSELKKFCKQYPQIKIFDAGKNLGVSVGRNYLLQHTTEEWMFFVDNDIYVRNNDWLQKFVVHMKNQPNVEVFVPKLFNLHENSFVTYCNWALSGDDITYYMPQNGVMSNFPGGASIIDRKVFRKLGLYDDQMFVGFEDFEFAIRGLVNQTPVTAQLINDIELVHDHRKIVKQVDKEAVLVRYNEDSHEKSLTRIQKKYPNLNFEHEWQNWVAAQKSKLISSKELDLFALTPEYNFGAKSKNRTTVTQVSVSNQNKLSKKAADDLTGFLSKNKFDKILIFNSACNADQYEGLDMSGKIRIISLTDLIRNNSINNLHTLLESDEYGKVTEKEKLLIIVDHILEKLEDPRILLREIKKLLMLNKNNEAKIFSKERKKEGIDYPEDETSYREWKEEELKLHLSSGGFIVRDSQSIFENGISTLSFTISMSVEKYEEFLEYLRLPRMNMSYLMCSNEHGQAKLTGGIGSYVEEAEKLFRKDEFGILLVSSGNLRPTEDIILKERIITLDKFFDQQVLGNNEVAEMLFRSIQVVQYLYPYLSIVEVQDVEGYGYRLTQAKKAGLLAENILIQIVSHGSKTYLENASQKWLPLKFYNDIYKEKIALENADRVLFPTRFINKLYKDAGYVIKDENTHFVRLPFEFHKFPPNQYKNVDTLIFFGKRYVMKGYDVFSEIVTLLDIDGYIGTTIKRIVLIGPVFTDMVKQNNYFTSLRKRIEVIEVSLKREEAIAMIKKYHSQAVCVLPYKCDNHPYSVLEIVETGSPFIFAQAGGIPELLPEKYHDRFLGKLNPDDLALKVKNILSIPNKERYELYSSIFTEVTSAQKEYNKKFASFNKKQPEKLIAKRPEITSSMIVYYDSENTEYNSFLLKAINNQTRLPEKLYLVYKGNVDKEVIKKSINEKILVEYQSCSENYNQAKNNILKSVNTDIVIVIAYSDIPKSDLVEMYSVYLRDNTEMQCVSSYADLVDSGKDPYESSHVTVQLKPIGEVGILDTGNKNFMALESCAFRTSLLVSLSGWEELSDVKDNLLTFIKIKSNGGRIGTVTKPLVLRINTGRTESAATAFPAQTRYAINSCSLDKFDTYRLMGMIRDSGLDLLDSERTEAGFKTKMELTEIDKYLITIQTLLLNGKIYEANDVVNNIDEKILKSADRTLLNKINDIKKKTGEIIKKLGGATHTAPVNEQPLVSVIIPTYNRPVQLKETIESVLTQTYRNYEILVINDAGKDVSSLIKSFNNDKIKYIVHKQNKGLAGARNTGLTNARGTYISFLDDDDIFYPNHLQTLVTAIQNSGCKVVYTDAYRCIQKKENDVYVAVKKELQYSFDYSQRILFIMNIAPVQCFLFERSLLGGKALFDESLTTHEDWEFWIKLSILTEFEHVKEVTSEYRHREDNTNMVTTKLPDFLRTMKIIYNRYANSVVGDEEVLAHQKRRMLELEEQILKESIDNSCSIVIVTYNSEKDISNCVKSVEGTLRAKDEVIIVDNKSTDNTIKVVKGLIENKSNFRLIANEANLGFSAGTNVGIRDARNPYVILLNPDTMVTSNWIESLVAHLEKDANAGAVGPISNYVAGLQKMELYAKKKLQGNLRLDEVYNLYKSWNDGTSVETKILIGFCLIIRKSLIEELDLLDEKLFLGNDDLDLSWRLRLKGYKLLVACDTFVYHKGQQSFKTVKKSKTDQLVQESTDILYEKLARYYGAENIPTPVELWGMDWFKPTNPRFNKDAGLFIPEEKLRVSMVIPVFNQLEYTKQCVESINKTVDEKIELVIVNNASSDGTGEYLRNYKSEKIKFKIVDNETNLGFPIAVNQGIKEASGGYVIIANNDIVFTDGWLKNMIEIAEKEEKIGIVGPISNEVSGLQKDENAKYGSIDQMHKYAAEIGKKNNGVYQNFPRLAFLCTLIKRNVITAIGGLDERFSPGNYEDDDFCLRAQLAGFKTVIAKGIFIHHYGSKSFKADGTKKYSERLETNKNIFIKKWGATPDEIWLKNKSVNPRQYLFPINKNRYNEGIERARVYIADKEYLLALASIENSIDLYNEQMEAEAVLPIEQILNMAGNLAMILDNYEKARLFFENELQLNPVSSTACSGLGDVLINFEQYKEAKTMYEWGIKNDPDNQQAAEGLKRVNELLGLKENDNSLNEEEIMEKSVEEILNDALGFFEEQNLQGAIDYLEKVDEQYNESLKENNPVDDVAAFYNMKGFVYLGLQEIDNARFNFEQALNINASSSQACLGLGEIFLLNDQLSAAKTMFEWGVKNNPKNDIAVEALTKVESLLSGVNNNQL